MNGPVTTLVRVDQHMIRPTNFANMHAHSMECGYGQANEVR